MTCMVDVQTLGMNPDGVTSNDAAYQAILNNQPIGKALYYPNGTYRLSSRMIQPKPFIHYMEPGAMLWWDTPGSAGLSIQTDWVRFEGNGWLRGPGYGVSVANEALISMSGTGISALRTRLELDGLRFENSGAYGLFCEFVDEVDVRNPRFSGITQAAMSLASSRSVRIEGARGQNIGSGAPNGQSYGIQLTHNSIGYNTDPPDPRSNYYGKNAQYPFCSRCIIKDSEMSDAWEPFDVHGGWEIHLSGLRAYNSVRGISLATSSGDALNYAGSLNMISDCIVDGRTRDGIFTGRQNTGPAVTVNGGSAGLHTLVTVRNVKAYFKGIPGDENSGVFSGVYTRGADFDGCQADWWGGSMFILDEALGVKVRGAHAGNLASSSETVGRIVAHRSAGSYPISIVGCTHWASAGREAKKAIYTPYLTNVVAQAGNAWGPALS